jgi:mannose/fructose/N-acetylgalactosamine-specific phosphotransferase system component IID
MYLVVVAWLYVVLMMVVAEATHSTGSILGAIVTFFLYGLLPVALVVYLMSGPYRRQRMRAREAAQESAHPLATPPSDEPAPGPGQDR